MRPGSSFSWYMLIGAWLALAALSLYAAIPLGAQPPASAPARGRAVVPDSTLPRCMSVDWLDPSMICEGRLLNATSLALIGSGAGALAGVVGGAVAPTACLGDAEKNAVRGAIAGAAAGALGGLLVRHVSRRELAARNARARESARRDPPRPWSWRDVRPLVVALGSVAATGGVIGGVQGSRSPSPCAGGVGGGALQGVGVYAAGGAATVAGTMLVVRFLF